MTEPFVSVVVATFDREEEIRGCLEALSNQTYNRYEVIVVEDGSDTNTEEIVVDYGFRYLYQDNAGPAAARNKGVDEARGDVVAFTDDDCVPAQDWIETLVAGLDSENVGGAGGVPYYSENSWHSKFHRLRMEKNHDLDKEDACEGNRAGSTSNICYRKDVFEEVGGFDNSFYFPGKEDSDLKRRIEEAGYTVKYVPAVVKHERDDSYIEFLEQQFRMGRAAAIGGQSKTYVLYRLFALGVIFSSPLVIHSLTGYAWMALALIFLIQRTLTIQKFSTPKNFLPFLLIDLLEFYAASLGFFCEKIQNSI